MTGGITESEIIVDNFAGGGGASTGIEAAFGRPVDIAINHDREAVAMHDANHPHTLHYCQSIWRADPIEVAAGRPIGLAWFSPDCKHFSKAKGGKPVEKHIRDLAWVVVDWAKAVRPRVIMLENVEEFRDWGPLITTEDGRQMPCPARKGLTFRRWVRELRALGYQVEWRELRACEYSGIVLPVAPTIRKRLFVIARCDGLPIVWPAQTHGAGLIPYRTAAECIDWSIPCPSIFERSRPLAEATMRRIARGVMRYVVNAKQPFIVPMTHTGGDRVHPIDEPLRTITTAQRGELALVSPQIVGVGGRMGQSRPRGGDEPFQTVTSKGDAALVAAFLAQHNTGVVGHDARSPISTLTSRGTQQGVVTAILSHAYTSNTAGGAGDPRRPMKTITAGGGHHALVAAFLTKYYGTADSCGLAEPLHTVTSKDRFGLVTVEIAGEPYAIADIGMRMLTPRELFRAQGFPDSYIIDPVLDGKPLTKTAQIRMCGNSVCPPIAEALVRANLVETVERVAA